MDTKRLDNAFARYVETRAPGDLARVFDLAAPDLYRVALHLVGSAADAEDVLQATFLAVLESADSWKKGRAAAPWLNGILANRARVVNRKRARDGTPTEEPAVQPAADELAGAKESHALVTAEVDKLPEEERRVVVLSCWYGMKPAQIAHALEESPGAVRTRLHRALEKLRRRVPAHVALPAIFLALATPGLAAVRSAVLVHAAAVAPVAVTAGVVGGIVVSTSQKIIAAGVAAVLLGTLGWYVWNEDDVEGDGFAEIVMEDDGEAARVRREMDVEETEGDVDEPAEESTAAPGPRPRRVAEEVSRPLATGDVALRLRWKDDDAPAARVAVHVIPWKTNSLWYGEYRVSDAAGMIDLEGLPAGRIGVYCDGRRGGGSFTLEPDSRVTKVIRVTRGADVSGVVVDENDRPVPGAEIHAGEGFVDGQAAAVSDGLGRFTIEGLQSSRVALGARKKGHTPSLFVELTEKVEGPVKLTLGPGGTKVAGRVLDESGHPVAGAVVVLAGGVARRGTIDKIDGRSAEGAKEWRCDTGADGRFEFVGVEPGARRLRARAVGCLLHEQDLDLTADLDDVLVTLLPGVHLSGTVRDGDGDPVVKASVGYGGYGDFDAGSTSTDDEGRYELHVVQAGDVEVRAKARGLGEVRQRLTIEPGQARRWDPVLDAGRVIAGFVLDADRRPVAGLTIQGRTGNNIAGRNFWVQDTTDENGAFRLVNCEDEPYRVEVERWGGGGGQPFVTLAVRKGVQPDGPELEIVLPAGPAGSFVTGRVVDADGAPVAGAELQPSHFIGQGSFVVIKAVSAADGTFEIGPFMEGKYSVWLEAAGFARRHVGTYVFDETERRDVGDVVLERPGFVSVSVTLAGKTVESPTFDLTWVRSEDDSWGLEFEAHREDGRVRSQPLTPGVYKLGVTAAGGVFGDQRTIEIREGETVRVDFTGALREGR